MERIDKLSSDYWAGHHIEDGCKPLGTLPISYTEGFIEALSSIKQYSAEKDDASLE